MSLDESLREMLREIVRDEIRPLREELRSTIDATKRTTEGRSGSSAFLTVEDVAEMMKVTQATVRSWIKAGTLAASRPAGGNGSGRLYRVARVDLDAFVRGGMGSLGDGRQDIKGEAADIVTLALHRRKL
jgi:excisionase family DNA binding protein